MLVSNLRAPRTAALVAMLTAACDGSPAPPADAGLDAARDVAVPDIALDFSDSAVAADVPADVPAFDIALGNCGDSGFGEPLGAAVNRVKNLLSGMAATDAEIAMVRADPAALDGLVAGWMMLPGYREKQRRFFVNAFQQDQFNYAQFVFQFMQLFLFDHDVEAFMENIQESFARTAQQLVDEGRPFTETLTTHRFMMTPAVMAAYATLDNIVIDDRHNRTDPFQTAHPTRFVVQSARPIPIEDATNPASPDFMTFYNPSIVMTTGMPGCTPDRVEYPAPANSTAIAAFLYSGEGVQVPGTSCSPRYSVPGYVAHTDFTDWRMVTTRAPAAGEETTPFYAFPAMRAGHELVLNTPRLGFFTTPAFFARWPTNDSNLARVLINQTAIVALGRPFDLTNPTVPESLIAVDMIHAPPGTMCFGCHRALDPMRQYFRQSLSIYGSPQYQPGPRGMPGEFAFHGVTGTGNSLDDLASRLASHPFFATAWTQRLCTYANSAPCDETDAEFIRVSNVFRDSAWNWNTLVRTLFASPLVTHLRASAPDAGAPSVSVARQDHLCALFSARLGQPDVCGLRAGTLGVSVIIRSVARSWASDQFGRGQAVPSMPATPTMMSRGGIENLCAELATRFVDTPESGPFVSTAPDMAVHAIATRLMGLTGERVAPVEAILQAHFADAQAGGASAGLALRSTFVLGCSSEAVLGIGL